MVNRQGPLNSLSDTKQQKDSKEHIPQAKTSIYICSNKLKWGKTKERLFRRKQKKASTGEVGSQSSCHYPVSSVEFSRLSEHL